MKVLGLKISRVSLIAGLYLVAATAPRIASFLLLPVYAFILPPEQLVAYGVAVSMASLIGILSDAGILSGIGITYWAQPEEDRASYLKSTVLLSRLVSIAILVPVGLLLAHFWDPLFGSGMRRSEGLWLVLAFAFLQRGNNLAGAIYRNRRHHREFALTRILPAAVQVVAGGLFVFVLHWGALGAVAAAPLGFLVSIVVVGLRRSPEEPARFKMLTANQAVRIISRGAPILPEQLARWAQMLSLRPLMSVFASARETASFTFSTAPAQLVSPFSEAYEQYISPRYYESSANHDYETIALLRQISSMFLAIGSIGTILAIVIFDPVFRVLAPRPYEGAAGLAAIGLAGMVLRGPMALLVHNLRVEDRRLGLIGTVVVGSLVSYVQFFVLVRSFESWSAAWSVYLYPAAACAVALLVLRDKNLRLVSARALVTTGTVVLTVLLTMVVLHARTPDGRPIEHFWLLGLVGLAGGAVIAHQVIRPHLATTVAVVRNGLPTPRAAGE